MIDLYHHGSSVCAAKVASRLARRALPGRAIISTSTKGDQFAPEYLKLNPKGGADTGT